MSNERKPINRLSQPSIGFLVQWMRWAMRLSQEDFNQIKPIMEQIQGAHLSGEANEQNPTP